ncbi:TPA: phage holin, lambda family [Haemophilus influenzae]
MPIKEPDVWALIWSWLQINLSSSSIQSALWALFISILRLGFMRKKPSFRYVFIDAAMCASIAGVAVPICTHIFGHSEYSSFLGTMIGFVGTEKIREFLFKFINRRIEKDDNDDFRSDVR